MPVLKCANGKWRIGSGDCIYDKRENAERAYKAYLAKKHIQGASENETRLKSLLKEKKRW